MQQLQKLISQYSKRCDKPIPVKFQNKFIELNQHRNFSVKNITARKVSKYGVFCGLYFPVFGLNTGKYEPEKNPYMDNFRVVYAVVKR